MSWRDLIYGVGGGIRSGKGLKCWIPGGASAPWFTPEVLDEPVTLDDIARLGSMAGSGAVVVMDETTCMVDVARFFLTFTKMESCGKCVPCRIGLKAMLDILERITEGRGEMADIDTLLEMGATIKKASLCGLGQAACSGLVDTLKYFRDDYDRGISGK